MVKKGIFLLVFITVLLLPAAFTVRAQAPSGVSMGCEVLM